jgi:hypothetical protein
MWEPLAHAHHAPASPAPRPPPAQIHGHRLPAPPWQDLLSPEATVTGAAMLRVRVEWREDGRGVEPECQL